MLKNDRDEFDDDYVAQLLAEDAKKTSARYAIQGLSAFVPQRRATDLPKPNTRFLSHIVREADHHNASLKRKEGLEAERRLRALQDNDEPPRKRRRADETDGSKRNRMFKNILVAAQSDRTGRSSKADDARSSRRDEYKHDKYLDEDYQNSRRHRSHDRDNRNHKHKSSGRRDSSPDLSHLSHDARLQQRARHKSPTSEGRNHEARSGATRADRRSPLSGNLKQFDGAIENESSVPEPTIRIRGRGAHRKASGIDDRFSGDYDPTQDVSLDTDRSDDAEDWDLALEAMRDRVKWKQNHASRMREAGFDDKEISQWGKAVLREDERERDLTSVRWSRKGELREWDAGKVEQ